MGFIDDVFLSKDKREVMKIFNEIIHYWKNTNNFLFAHKRYYQDIVFKYDIQIKDEIIADLPTFLITTLVSKGISQRNSMYIFAQFLYYFVFGHNMPNRKTNSEEYIVESLSKIDYFMKNNSSIIDVDFKIILDKSFAKKI